MRFFVDEEHLQDIILRLPFPGRVQGYYVRGETRDLSQPLYRVSYFKEIYVISELNFEKEKEKIIKTFNWKGVSLLTHQSIRKADDGKFYLFLRFIPFSGILDFTSHIPKRWEPPDFEEQYKRLLEHVEHGTDNVPIRTYGREIEDFIDLGGAKKKYLFHGIHIFPGAQFPRMIRALINILQLNSTDVFLDPFNGGGTMCIEAMLMGYDSIGNDNNPLFNKIYETKYRALFLDPDNLITTLKALFKKVKSNLKHKKLKVIYPRHTLSRFLEEEKSIKALSPKLPVESFKKIDPQQLYEIKIILKNIAEIKDYIIRDLCYVILSNILFHISKGRRVIVRRRFIKELVAAIKECFLFQKIIKPNFDVKLGRFHVTRYDARKLKLHDESVGGIITSPPYLDAVRYFEVGALSMFCLELIDEQGLEKLKTETIGCEEEGVILESLVNKETRLPEIAKETIKKLIRNPVLSGKSQLLFRYYLDMYEALQEIYRVLKHGGRFVLVLAEPHFWKHDKKFTFVPNSEILKNMGESVGFKTEYDLFIPLAKEYRGLGRRVQNGERLIVLRKGYRGEVKEEIKEKLTELKYAKKIPPPDWRRTIE